MLRQWYTGEQDDANQAMARIINTAPSVKRVCQGKFANMTLKCRVCSQSEVAIRSLDDLVFCSLEVLTREETTERSFSNLQEAVDDWFAPDLKPDTFHWQCGKCHAQQPLECRNSPELPPVLVIGLKQ